MATFTVLVGDYSATDNSEGMSGWRWQGQCVRGLRRTAVRWQNMPNMARGSTCTAHKRNSKAWWWKGRSAPRCAHVLWMFERWRLVKGKKLEKGLLTKVDLISSRTTIHRYTQPIQPALIRATTKAVIQLPISHLPVPPILPTTPPWCPRREPLGQSRHAQSTWQRHTTPPSPAYHNALHSFGVNWRYKN